MDRVVEIHAGQDGEDIGLNCTDEKFQASEGNGHDQRQRRTKNAEETKLAHNDDEAGEDFERDVTGQDIAEQTHGERNRAAHEGDELDRRHDGKDIARHARGNEVFF